MTSNKQNTTSPSPSKDHHMAIPDMQLRKSSLQDLELFFTFQLDERARNMAAFTSKDTTNKQGYLNKYGPFLNDPTINMQTIVVDTKIVGSISKFEIEGEAELTYWIDNNHWGRGIAKEALRQFLLLEKMRPIYGRTAFDNIASQKVLLHNGFIQTGMDKGFANARNMEIDEYIFKLV